MCDLIDDVRSRIITSLQSAGVSAEVAGMVAAEVSGGLAQDWAGERPYIGTAAAARLARSLRDMRIRRDWKNGERTELLARRYQLSRVRIWQIVSGA